MRAGEAALSIRAALRAALVAIALLAVPPNSAWADNNVRFVSPTGSGARSGLTVAHAGTLADLSAFIAAVGPGGRVVLLADRGSYAIARPVSIGAGGAADRPVSIEGADGNGRPAKATIVGDRTKPGDERGRDGTEGFRLLAGADHLRFSRIAFENLGNGAIRVGADIAGLEIADVSARNVARFFEDNASGDGASASIDGLTMRSVDIAGYSKGAIRLQDDTRRVLIENVTGDSERQPGGLYVVGIHLEGTVHDVVLRGVTMKNSDGRGRDDQYWNGDGFATEKGTRDIAFESTVASGNTDAGYDLKSRGTTLLRARASDNMRNYRIWGESVLTDCVSEDPKKRGGKGSQNHLWIGKNAEARLSGGTLADDDAGTTVALVEKEGRLVMRGTAVRVNPAARPPRVEAGGSVDVEAKP